MTVPLAAVWAAVALSLPALAALLVANAGRLAAGQFATPGVFALTHTATLAWGTLTIFGASYQMSQSLLGQRLAGDRWIPWQLAGFASGTLALIAGFHHSRLEWVVAGGILVVAAAWLFLAIMVRSTRALRAQPSRVRASVSPPGAASADRRQGRWVHGLAMAAATTCLGLVTAWGVVLALALRYPFWPAVHRAWAGLAAHATLGLGGWFALMVAGVSFRLVPLIHGTRPVHERRALAVTLLLLAAVGLAVAGAPGPNQLLRRLAVAAALAAHAVYCLELHSLLKQRRRRTPDLNVHHWYAVMAWGWALAAMAVVWAALGPGRWPAWAPAAATGLLGGWVTQAILGQLYKVTPFLMWHYRAYVPDVLAIPNLPDLYAPRAGRVALWATNLGMAAVVAATATGSPPVARAGAWLFAAGAACASWLFGYSWLGAVLRRRLVFTWRR
ncbi:MAG TPA: hypothetical protein VIL11_07160 [Limnochordales bacterium]